MWCWVPAQPVYNDTPTTEQCGLTRLGALFAHIAAMTHDVRPLTPFDAPRTPPPAHSPLKQRARWALALVLAPVAALGAAVGVAAWGSQGLFFTAIMALGVLLAIIGLGIGVVTWAQLLLAGGWGAGGVFTALSASVLGLVTTSAGGLVTLLSLGGFSRGRQLRRWGRPMFAELEPESAWVDGTRLAGEHAPSLVARQWRSNGCTEHASVAAFARLAVDLVALGAPPRLIEAAHGDALDELRHTQLCFSLARDLDGGTAGPASFPQVSKLRQIRGPRHVALARLAVESLVDGALNEGVSARVVAQLVHQARDPRVKDVLQVIARDEARHAAHGFDVLRWCLRSGGPTVAAAVRGALRAIPSEVSEVGYDGPDAEAWGLPSAERLQAVYTHTLSRLQVRTQRLLDEVCTIAPIEMQGSVGDVTSSVN